MARLSVDDAVKLALTAGGDVTVTLRLGQLSADDARRLAALLEQSGAADVEVTSHDVTQENADVIAGSLRAFGIEPYFGATGSSRWVSSTGLGSGPVRFSAFLGSK